MTTEIQPTKTLVPFGKQGVELSSLEDAFRFATAVSKSGFAPKGVDTPEAILIAVQFGAELGLTPMSALQSLAIINGRPAIYGDAALALVRSSGELEKYVQATTGEGDSMKASVTVKRKGEAELTSEFSVADAKKAQLWGKTGPWSQYPGRMLMWRARGFALRDAFGDILRGLRTAEEAEDLPPEKNVTPAPRARVPKELPAIADAKEPEKSSDPISEAAKEPPKPATEVVVEPQDEPVLLQEILTRMQDDDVTTSELIKVLIPQRLASKQAKTMDDLAPVHYKRILDDWSIIKSVVKEGRMP